MSLQAEIIHFTLRTGTGSQTIPQVLNPSMTAKAVIFIAGTNFDTSSAFYSYGFDDGTTHIGAGVALAEAFGVCLSARSYTPSSSLSAVAAQAFFGGAAYRVLGYVSAFNVGSFDINVTLNDLPGSGWTAVILGGSDVECVVGNYDVSAGSGTVNVGFDPVALLKLSTVDAGGDGLVAGAYHDFGFATDCSSDQQVGWGVSCGAIDSNATSFQIDGVIQQDIAATSTTLTSPISMAFVANGFTVTTSGTPDWNIGYLAIGGDAVSANLVQILQPTSTGVQNSAITATDPVIAFFGSTCKVATTVTGNVDANLAFGVYDGVAQTSNWWGGVNGAPFPYKRAALESHTKCITLATATGAATSTVNAAASCALSSQNIALNWSTADETRREVWALVLAQNLTGSTNPCGNNTQGSITVMKQTTPIPGGATDFPFGATGGLSPGTFTLQDGGSRLFANVSPGTYGITESAPDGWAASYEVSNGSPHDAIVLSGTEAITVTVTDTFQSTPISGSNIFRVLRRFALPYDGNKRIFVPRIEIIAQMGVGNADDAAPIMQLRISPDGGETWGPYRDMPLGAAGSTMVRAYLTRFCQGIRNPVAELICDAPVFVALVACELPQGFTVGTS